MPSEFGGVRTIIFGGKMNIVGMFVAAFEKRRLDVACVSSCRPLQDRKLNC